MTTRTSKKHKVELAKQHVFVAVVVVVSQTLPNNVLHGPEARFSKIPSSISGPESCSVFAAFAVTNKVSIFSKILQ